MSVSTGEPQFKFLETSGISGSAGPHVSRDCLSTFHARFGEIVHGL